MQSVQRQGKAYIVSPKEHRIYLPDAIFSWNGASLNDHAYVCAPGIGGLVVVGRMLADHGGCKLLGLF